MRTIALLFILAMAAIYVAVRAVQPRALQKESPAEVTKVDISHPPSSIGSATFIAAPHIAHDAKADAAK